MITLSRPNRPLLRASLLALAFASLPASSLAAPFTDVGGSSGTGDATDDRGVAWGDYNSDGYVDLYLSKNNSPNRLYGNNGNGTFTDVGATSGTNNTGAGRGVSGADYDNDGDLDLYLVNGGSANRLYRHNANGTFTDVGAASGTANIGDGKGTAWGDYDSDGYVDLYVANYGSANRLYHNNGNGTFTDVGVPSGTGFTANSTGVAWGDFDNDNDLDLYVAGDNLTANNKLYRNNGDGTFTNVATASGTNDSGANIGVAWGDYDNDGDLDLYVTKYGTANRLFRNNGNGTFTDVAPASGTADTGNGTGVAWGDYDNDRDLDLYVVNEGSANRHYRNNGNGTFTEIGAAMGTDDGGNGQGVAWADYDLDGDLDLYLANSLGANRLYRNDATTAGNHWLHVNLVGVFSNGSGIGARVRCVAGGVTSIREISGGSGYLSQCSLTAEFGLGAATSVTTLEVRWPSGRVQALAGVEVDRRLTVYEPQFTDVALAAGVQEVGQVLAGGAAWGDYDHDGDLDLYFARPEHPNRLYRNNGNGTFSDVAAASGTEAGWGGSLTGRGFAWGDYDNDGDLDLSGAGLLYRNNNDATFTEVAAASGINPTGIGSAWGDYNNDGNLDLVIIDDQTKLYKNLGNGTFTEVAVFPGGNGFNWSANWTDYDNDRDLDLYLAGIPQRLYRNNHDGTFTDVSASSGLSVGGSIGADWGDYDNDGDLDVYTTGVESRLWQNNGGGTFTDATLASNTTINQPQAITLGVGWADFDNDGDLDLWVNNTLGRTVLFQNSGSGTFGDVSWFMGIGTYAESADIAWGDFDTDGDLDAFTTPSGVGVPSTATHLFRNDCANSGHWLHMDLVGTGSNRSGIGARVRCVAGGRTSVREISGGLSQQSQGSLTAEFGLGAATAVDSLVITWPSGVVQAVASPAVDQRITVTEPLLALFQFTEAGAASGTNDNGPSHGVAWGDYDHDGDLDLYLAQFGGGPNRLYRNNGNGTFTDVAAASGTVGTGSSTAAVWGDYDNDGDLDLYLACRGGANQLFRNNDNGTFTEVGAASGTNDTGLARGAAWADYDNDGLLDLYVANTGANRLYHNLGNGTFTEVGATTGTNDAGDGTGVAWGDYDSDGDLDLAVANYFTPNRLYQNNGNGTFADVTVASGTDFTGPSHGVAWGDYDNDGDLDLYLANHGAANRLYRNNGNGTFADVGAASGTNDAGLSRGVAWGDFDDDGYLDLFVSNEGVSRLYKNNRNGTFTDVAGAYGVGGSGTVVGVAWADYDQDGDLDLYVAVYDGANRLYRNDNIPLVANHWLGVDLVGTASNRAGIGARVRCVAGGRQAIREISGGSGYLSQEPLTARFGLGLTATVDTLEVRWPSGIVQVLTNPAIDQRITVTEQETSAAPDGTPLPQAYSLYANAPNPFNPATVISFDLPSPGTVQLTVLDVTGRPVRKLLSRKEHPAGHHRVTWDGRSDGGSPVASGVYFYRIVANDFRATRRMTLLK